ncbi:YibE/F family protein [Sporanaerobacter sp. PP17-6a]|uniref:YibE/F family protein n=1 Tax=Sporanaerobacter sp. PP17-6a TaxID=1891289 RepID=UPI00089FE451|nr:YibE/F family protein [Sporanaerobacter sp. PP17-6a]SCL86373.1 YibE/F-like protein [Sporanaerobacter sp. PP17-6a]
MERKNIKRFGLRWGLPVLLALVLILLVVRLNQVEKTEIISRAGQTFETGVVTEILEDNMQEDGTRVGQQTVVVRMTSGVKKGQLLKTTSSAGYLFGTACKVGMKVVVMQSVAGNASVTSIYSQDRSVVLYAFAALYLLALCLVGGKQGIRGALALVFTFVSIAFIYLPLVYQGVSPFWTAVLICALAATVTLYLISGPTRKTLVATLGTLAGIIAAGVFATLFSAASGVTGWNVSDIENLLTLWETNEIQVGGLLFSGLLISSLGAVIDIAVSIGSAMYELCVQNPNIGRQELFHAGMRIGRDMMGTDSNTLILAFAGSSISMLVLDYAYDLPWLQIINSNNIGIAVMQGLSGSFGIILSVPATVLLASYIYTGKRKAGNAKGD